MFSTCCCWRARWTLQRLLCSFYRDPFWFNSMKLRTTVKKEARLSKVYYTSLQFRVCCCEEVFWKVSIKGQSPLNQTWVSFLCFHSQFNRIRLLYFWRANFPKVAAWEKEKLARTSQKCLIRNKRANNAALQIRPGNRGAGMLWLQAGTAVI